MNKKIENITHSDTRPNIPTEELRGFVSEDEQKPKAVLYPRDPSLDPQLVWKGKDQQDAEDLSVLSVPIYIQEKIHPQAIIEDFRRQASAQASPAPPAQLDLFGDAFNGLPFEEQIQFYEHANHWSNRMILGDSLLVMNSLAEKEGLKGQVQMIYIDPPYGIKFGSNWQVSTRKRDVKDGAASDLTRQPEQVRAFRDTWEYGIHSYLAYLRDRLVVARELLTESGSVFVQIGDENVHLVRCLLDEVFGSENSCGEIVFAKTSGFQSRLLTGVADYLLWYTKNREAVKYHQLYLNKELGGGGTAEYRYAMLPDGSTRTLPTDDLAAIQQLPAGSKLFRHDNLATQGNPVFEVVVNGRTYANSYKSNPEGMARLITAGRVSARRSSAGYIRFLDDFGAVPLNALWTDTVIAGWSEDKQYVVQTARRVIERCLLMTTDPGDLVLDPTCGSGTTAYVAEQWGRRWITCDTSRVALTLARTRLMCAKFPYYLLADSPEGRKKESEIRGLEADHASLPTDHQSLTTGHDIKRGFVYQRVPHITLKSIANNEEIDTIHEKWQPALEDLRAKINQAFGKSWEEWEVPRTGDSGKKPVGSEAEALLKKWWDLRRERQQEIDASIARRADAEFLYDKPYEDNKRIRVTGPFTVESLSPHRQISVQSKKELEKPTEDGYQFSIRGAGEFGVTIIENMKKAGVQNTVKGERLKFDRLDIYPGEWLHAAGEYTEGETTKRVAVCVGPEFGTVTPDLVREAAKEAVKGAGFDTLLIAGLAFDPHVGEETKRYGNLVVLPTRINADLTMGDELLKKTGAGNLFMIFGEPDIVVSHLSGDQVQVTIRGVDIYDPTTGELRSDATDEIAAWFIDTSYNEESFFVRHAYFTGAGEPYDKLKRALRAEVDEAAWADLYLTTSRPFARPESGKIAVKVINHYGDEVLKVYDV
ncbi:MAG: site-specific DNA-methyltransferase [Armatimonadetes bacterium]|nr:site-specific DNA-methyltransferase [Armatimonadota bacterium]